VLTLPSPRWGVSARDVCRCATAKRLLSSTFMAQTGDLSRSIVGLTRTNVHAPTTYSVRWHGPFGGRAWVSCHLAVSKPPAMNARFGAINQGR
jgi:hypothetical protein